MVLLLSRTTAAARGPAGFSGSTSGSASFLAGLAGLAGRPLSTRAPAAGPEGKPERGRARPASAATGLKPWSTLSLSQKAGRTTRQSANAALILAGAGLTAAIALSLYAELVAPDGRTRLFNDAVRRVRRDRRCVAALVGGGDAGASAFTLPPWLGGKGRQIYAYGQASTSRWSRNRTAGASSWTDGHGVEHVQMQFHVRGPAGEGVCHLHVTRAPEWSISRVKASLLSGVEYVRAAVEDGASSSHSTDTPPASEPGTEPARPPSRSRWFRRGVEYEHLYVDVRGHGRIVLEDAAGSMSAAGGSSGPLHFLGVSWGSSSK